MVQRKPVAAALAVLETAIETKDKQPRLTQIAASHCSIGAKSPIQPDAATLLLKPPTVAAPLETVLTINLG